MPKKTGYAGMSMGSGMGRGMMMDSKGNGSATTRSIRTSSGPIRPNLRK